MALPTESGERQRDRPQRLVIEESVAIQGHRLRFASVDLTASHADLRARLLKLVLQE